MQFRYLPPLIMAFAALTHAASAEIHRAKSASYKSPRSRAESNARSSVDVAAAEMPSHEVAEDAALHTHMVEEAMWSRSTDVWVYSILGAILVGLSGIFPLLVIPLEAGPTLKHGGKLGGSSSSIE
ncbi:hypothetical protein BaRGS_00034460 [Batillaria attramentaria]|uniref:Uncharacterized protein n=1 Tax=Batillaria attramentaria TaxID=370345 RepID=A0ABD0JHT3_9CAEN